jgi:signal transduction histidine kinase
MADPLSAHAAALAALPSGVIAIGQADRITIITPAAAHLLDLHADRWLGQLFADLCGELRLPDQLRDQPQQHQRGEQRVTLRLITPAPALRSADLQRLLFVEPLAAEAIQAQDLVATISHEFRTPLAVILGFSDILLRDMAGVLSDDQREFVTQIRRRAQDTNDMLTQLILIADIAAGTLPIVAQIIPFPAALTQAREAVRRWLYDPEPRCLIRLMEPLPLVLADNDILIRALTYVIGWACVSAGSAGEVRIKATRTADVVVVTVEDSGPRLPDDARAQLFARPSSPASIYRILPRLGLHLYLAKQLIERNHGQLTLVPHAEPGTCFQLTLPIA